MQRFANPADKLSTIASEPWKEMKKGVTIVEIADLVRVKQIKSFDLDTFKNLSNKNTVKQISTNRYV